MTTGGNDTPPDPSPASVNSSNREGSNKFSGPPTLPATQPQPQTSWPNRPTPSSDSQAAYTSNAILKGSLFTLDNRACHVITEDVMVELGA